MNGLRRCIVYLLGTVSVLVSLVALGGTLNQASAVPGNCGRSYTASISTQSSGGGYWYATQHNIQDCSSVYVLVGTVNGSATCANFRVRTFDSSGNTATVGGWHALCEGNSNVGGGAVSLLSPGVGTRYRVESDAASSVTVWD